MKPRSLSLTLLPLLLSMGAAWGAGAPGAPEPFALQVRTNRTALWVGDRLEYTVRVEHSPGVEFILDHLKKEEMNLQPFELLEVRSSTAQLPRGRRLLEVRLLLTIYDTSHPEATVPSFNLFYFPRGQARGKEESPAEILTVPPLAVGIRSTLTGPGESIRDYKDALPVRVAGWMAPLILGLCGLAILAGYVAWLAVVQVRSGFWKKKLAERARKKSFGESLEEIREAPAESPQELESFYQKASEILRGMAAEKLGNGAGLAPQEMEAELRKAGAGERHAALLGALLDQCDHIRYAPDGLEQGRRLREEFLRKFEELAEHRL